MIDVRVYLIFNDNYTEQYLEYFEEANLDIAIKMAKSIWKEQGQSYNDNGYDLRRVRLEIDGVNKYIDELEHFYN